MVAKKRGLGRGLSDLGLTELLGDMQTQVATSSSNEVIDVVPTTTLDDVLAPAGTTQERMHHLDVVKITPGRYQPRRDFKQEALEELAASIKTQGLIQPIIVRQRNDKYEIIAGERRWRAAQIAGLKQIPAIVRDLPDEAAMAIGLIENIQRRDLNSIEEAHALQRLIAEFELTHQEIAEAIGKSRTVVTNLLRLLKLNPDVRSLVENGKLEMGHARALLALEGVDQSDAANIVVTKQLSVRETEALIRNLVEGGSHGAPGKKPIEIDPNVRRLQADLSDRIGAKVNIQHNAKGKGKLVVHFNNLDELDGILGRID